MSYNKTVALQTFTPLLVFKFREASRIVNYTNNQFIINFSGWNAIRKSYATHQPQGKRT